jgi:3-oxoacyl-[acyl-carrier protein] reductase
LVFVDTAGTTSSPTAPPGTARRAESPLGRVATAEEVAAAVLFLASPEAELTSGTVLDVNGASYLHM